MSIDGSKPRKINREHLCLGVLWGIPIVLVLISGTAFYLGEFYFDFIPEDFIGGLNAFIATVVTAAAGAIYDPINVSIARRIFHTLGFAALGLLLYSIPVLYFVAAFATRTA